MPANYTKIQIIAHQAAWWGCILSVKGQAPILAAVVMFAFTFFHLWMTRLHFKAELLMVMAAMLLGGLFDSLLVLSGALASPSSNSTKYFSPSLLISNFNFSDKAFTTETPTPCSPPDTLYESWSNFPPA